MRHIQLYESFGTERHIVSIYTEYPEWMEFMRSLLNDEYYNRINHTEYEKMWKDRVANSCPYYVVDNSYNKWFFYPNPYKYSTPDPRKIIVFQILQQGSIYDANQHLMETTLKCSYETLIDEAQSPEEAMLDMIQEDSSLIPDYSETRPLVFNKMLSLPGVDQEIKDTVKAFVKWNSVKKYI